MSEVITTEDLLSILKTIGANKLSLTNNKLTLDGYVWDLDTINDSDTWVPVMNQGKIEHRVIPAQIGTTASLTIELANSTVMTLNESKIYTYKMNKTDYLVHFHVAITTTQQRENLPAWRFKLNNVAATQYTPTHMIHRQAGNRDAYMSWVENKWVIADGAWAANTRRTWAGSCIVKF